MPSLSPSSDPMLRALALAERGRGRVSPNPLVGAVVLQRGRVVGEGWHARLGGPHAEIVALRKAGKRARGATMVVTLEPCAHHGRTPPCVDAIIAAGIRRCIIGVRDPHRIVDGRGIRRLRQAGIRVDLGAHAAQVREQLGGYWLAHVARRPRVTLKLATTLDGRLAPHGGFAAQGARRWLTGVAARREVHRLRAQSDAIVIGAGTARADDPRLTARGVGAGRQPLRIVCDTALRLPHTLRLLRAPLATGTVVACGPRASAVKAKALERVGVVVWRLPVDRGGLSIPALTRRLVRAGCHDVLVEGGARLAAAFVAASRVDRLWLFVAPVLAGAEGLGWGAPDRRLREGRILRHGRVGDDTLTVVAMR